MKIILIQSGNKYRLLVGLLLGKWKMLTDRQTDKKACFFFIIQINVYKHLQGKVGYFIEIYQLSVEKNLTIKLYTLHNFTI